MDIEDWRKKIDELDTQLVKLINDRAICAVEIGKLKQNSAMPVYESRPRAHHLRQHCAPESRTAVADPVAPGLRAPDRRNAPSAERRDGVRQEFQLVVLAFWRPLLPNAKC